MQNAECGVQNAEFRVAPNYIRYIRYTLVIV